MNLTTKDLLKHSFVITIDDKRFSDFKKVFRHHGLSPLPKRFNGTTDWWNSPQYNCYLSHRKVILKAKKLNWPFVCIFEDDAWPVNGVKDELEYYLSIVPETCKVLALGHICMLYNAGEEGEFIKSIRIYGAHAYVVFKDAYDKYIEQLDMRPEGDGALDSFNDKILRKEVFYMPRKNLFLQFNKSKSMNNHNGYILYKTMFDNKTKTIYISHDKRISEEEVLKMGFPTMEEVYGNDI